MQPNLFDVLLPHQPPWMMSEPAKLWLEEENRDEIKEIEEQKKKQKALEKELSEKRKKQQEQTKQAS